MSERQRVIGSTLGLAGSGCLLAVGGCAGFAFVVEYSDALGFIGALVFLVGAGMFLVGVGRHLLGASKSE